METSTSVYEHATYLFPNSDDSIKMVLRDTIFFLESAARPFVTSQYYVSIFGAALTILHFIVLTRKSMMTSSVMTIMIGMAVCDFVTMITTIGSNSMWFDERGTDCSPPVSLSTLKRSWVLVSFRDLARRASTWLGVLMALIRLVVVRSGARPRTMRFSEPSFGFYATAVCFSVSFFFSLTYYFRYDLVEDGSWSPMKNCTDIPLTTVLPIMIQQPSALFTDYNGIFGRAFMLVNGVVTKILPCILLPLLTFLLIMELRKADKVRKVSNFIKRPKTRKTSVFVKIAKRSPSERTTGLVIFVAASSFVVELPIGIAHTFQVSFMDLGYLYIATYVSHVCNAVFIVNATIHCLVFFFMSSQYRLTVANMLRIRSIQHRTISSGQMSKNGS